MRLLGTTSALLVLLAGAPVAVAADATWRPSGGTGWSDPENWSTGAVPGPGDRATIGSCGGDAAACPRVAGPVEVGSLVVAADGQVDVAGGVATLRVAGDGPSRLAGVVRVSGAARLVLGGEVRWPDGARIRVGGAGREAGGTVVVTGALATSGTTALVAEGGHAAVHVAAGGGVRRDGGEGRTSIGAPLLSAGTLDVRAGTLVATGVTQVGEARTALGPGATLVTGPGGFAARGGTLTGGGTIEGRLVTGSAQVVPTGTLVVTGDVAFADAATLHERAGAAGLLDRLVVGGSAALGGILEVESVAGPAPGARLEAAVRAAAVHGRFAAIAQRDHPWTRLRAAYAATGVDLVAVPLAPVATGSPSVVGRPVVGGVLRAHDGAWRHARSVRRRWQRCRAGTCRDLPGATGRELVVLPGDRGAAFRLRVVALGAAGSATATSPPTRRAAPSPAAAPLNRARPRLAGVRRVGGRLSCRPGRWSPRPARLLYQWLRDGRPLRRPSARPWHRTTSADRGHRLSCRVWATGPRGGAAGATSRGVRVR